MEPIRYIYKTTNLITGKSYIGSHLCRSRGALKSYYGSGKAIKLALKKYGKENFTKEILEYFSDEDNPMLLETKYIKQFNTLSPNGYNISPTGGNGIAGCHSEESKRNASLKMKGRKISPEAAEKARVAFLGKKHSEETKKRMSKVRKGRKVSPECLKNRFGMKRKKHTEETKLKISLAIKEKYRIKKLGKPENPEIHT